MSTDRKKAFTLIEVLATLAIILILAGTLLTGGKHLRVRAERQLTQSTIEIIGAALQQYYDQTDSFPPAVPTKAILETTLSQSVTVTGDHIDDATGEACWSSETLFYFLERISQSKAVLGGLSNRMLTNKGKTGVGLQVQFGGTTYDWVRFVDAWGTSLNYAYTAGDVFPVLTSAGPDRDFQRTTDNLSSQ